MFCYRSPQVKTFNIIYISTLKKTRELKTSGTQVRSTQQIEIMFKAGLILFALCAALFFAVFNCATISKETQAGQGVACVAGARKRKGEGEIERARNARREGEGKRKRLQRTHCLFRLAPSLICKRPTFASNCLSNASQ